MVKTRTIADEVTESPIETCSWAATKRASRRIAVMVDGDVPAVAGDASNLPAVALLFGQLVKYGLFSFGEYMQHLIARGEEGLSFTQPSVSGVNEYICGQVLIIYRLGHRLSSPRFSSLDSVT